MSGHSLRVRQYLRYSLRYSDLVDAQVRSGEMTVRPEKSTRSLTGFRGNDPVCLSAVDETAHRFWPGWEGTPGSSELIYIATESWRNSQCSCNKSQYILYASRTSQGLTMIARSGNLWQGLADEGVGKHDLG